MRHINPTLMAHTLPSGGACSTRAGTAPKPGNLERREAQLAGICQLEDFELPELTPLQRVQLSEIAREALDEEIDLLRLVLRQLKKAVISDEDETILLRLAHLLDVLGLTASRTASVIRVNKGVNTGSGDDDRVKDILSHLQDALLAEDTQKAGE
jgi:hypothetical protein